MKKNVFLIAEAGVNHNGSIELAKELIDVACEANVDAVKFQTFKAEKVITKNAKKCRTKWSVRKLFTLLGRFGFSKKVSTHIFETMLPYRVQYNESEYDIQIYNLFYKNNKKTKKLSKS